jgi:hypothetical protein
VLGIKLSFAKGPDLLSLKVSSDKELRLYDCSLPYRVAIDGKSAEIFVGARPPEPFELELTVPKGFEARLAVEADYLEPLVPYAMAGGQGLKQGSFKLLNFFDLHEGSEK